jgi:hypothetical protein
MEFEKITVVAQDVKIPIQIPQEYVREFQKELRIVIKHPWIIGIPVPERLLRPEILEKLGKDFDVMLTPKMQV